LKKEGYYLGIDVGSVSTNLVLTDWNGNVVEKLYLRTGGQPIKSVVTGLGMLAEKFGGDINVEAAGTTGSGRELAGVIAGADVVKNEITSHAVASQKLVPGVRTILEIGGQDSKIILLRNGVVHDFAMNTVCAAGTGSFLDRQAARLGIPVEELGSLALHARSPVRIAGRCAVFAESDMIHKQQTGRSMEDIVGGLCEALVRNYLNNLAKGKDIEEPVVFQGGVAANKGITAAFEKELGIHIIIPEYYDVMGAYGAALLAKQVKLSSGTGFRTSFLGFGAANNSYNAKSIDCSGCSNMCEVIEILSNGKHVACWGDRCGKWSGTRVVARSV
jgi:predicted CoA-substrate-specific enzyme activase